jgi:CBS domain-containing protein
MCWYCGSGYDNDVERLRIGRITSPAALVAALKQTMPVLYAFVQERKQVIMLENVKVREWMTSPVVSCMPATPISKAHQVMKENGIRRLPIVDDGRVVGIITIGDVREASPSDATTLSIWELNYLWAQLTVEKVMTHKVITIEDYRPILDAAELMLNSKVSGLPVVDDQGKLVGMITESDIFRMLIKMRSVAPKA